MRHPDERPDGGSLGTGDHPDEGTIHAWLDDALSPAEGAALELHAAACADCRRAIAEARGLIAASSRIVAALDAVPAGVLPERVPVAPVGASAAAATPPPRAAVAASPVGHRRALRWSGRVRALAALALVAVGATLVVQGAGWEPGVADMLTAERSMEGGAGADAAREPAPAVGAAEPQRALASELGVPAVSDVPAPPRGATQPAPGAAAPAVPAAEKVQESAVAVAGESQRAAADAALPEPVPVPVPPPPPLPLAATTAQPPVAATSDAVGRVARQESRSAGQRGAISAAAPAPPAPPPAASAPAVLGDAAARSLFAATPSIAGQVLDLASGAPVAGAIVSVEGAESTALTDAGGRFTLQRIPAGSQTATVRRAGFESARVPVDVPDSAAAAAQLVVRLRPTTDTSGELTVTDVPVDPRRDGPAAQRARQFADCYRLEVLGRPGAARDAVERALPGWVSLTLEPTEPPQWLRAMARTGSGARRGYWRASDRQRIELIWVAAQGELRLRLGGSAAGSELTGRATWAPGATVSDAGGADVRARRTGCDVPPG